jgi:predicted transcriptional regulator
VYEKQQKSLVKLIKSVDKRVQGLYSKTVNIREIDILMMQEVSNTNNFKIVFDYDKLHETLRNIDTPISELAKMCGLSRSGLYKKLNGEREFRVSECIMLCKILKISVDDLVKIIKL